MNKVLAITIIYLTMACSNGYTPVIQEVKENAQPIILMWGQSNVTPGFAPYLIDALEAATGARVVNCAFPATIIQQWQPGGSAFNFCVDLVKRNTASGDYYLVGIVGGIGETNGHKGITFLFAELMVNTFQGFRDALGNVRIVVPQIGIIEEGYGEAEDWALIQQAQFDAVEQLDNAFIFGTQSFASLVDWVHNDAGTQRSIGELIAGYF